MKRRRWRRIAMWAGLAACGSCALLALSSPFYYAGVMLNSTDGAGILLNSMDYEGVSITAAVSAASIGLEANWGRDRRIIDLFHSPAERRAGFLFRVFHPTWTEYLAHFRLRGPQFQGMPLRRTNSYIIDYRIPLWIPFLLFAIPTFFLWRSERRDRRRAAAGACGGCGYDLTGNVTDRCPECGAAADSPPASKLPS